jgi:tetratricopeptide (TPR) repeat protein
MRHLAYVFYSRHEFAPAAAQARKAIDMNAADGNSYGILGDALLEIGEYDEAKEAYQKMMRLDDSLYSRSRLAGLKSLHGDPAGAIADLEQALAAGEATRHPAESVAWTQWQLGCEHFASGKLKEAEAHYLRSLQSYPNYYRALAGLAQVRGAQKRYEEAIDLYQKALAVLPMPEYAAALGDIYGKTGRPERARQQYELVEYIGYLNTLNKVLYNRELAYFYADHDVKAQEGLELARQELNYRRDIYAYDVVAWNLHKNGKLEEAREAIDKALRLGTKDAKLFFHAGMIYHALGAKDKAKEYLARALGTNPYFHPIFADMAAQILKQLETALGPAVAENQRQGG